mgnify:CR=1 FL=1
MKKLSLSFEEFEKWFKNRSEKDKHTIFWCSLFDGSTFEELEKKENEIKIEFEDLKKIIKEKVIGSFPKRIKRRIKGDKEEFIRKFVYSDKLCKYALVSALKEKGIKCKANDDIYLLDKGVIEVKRLVSGSYLKEYIQRFLEKIKEEKKKYLILLLFPQIGEEIKFRVSQLIEVCYSLEDFLREKDENVKLLCYYVSKDYDEAYGLENLVKKIIKAF